MDFDGAKENIQPLAQGRNASILQASLKVESPQELLAQRKDFEKEIHNYSGDDPLNAWYNYIEWIEQSFPSGGKESGLQEVLSKCLSHFESDQQYIQDRRMIKLYIKFIDSHKDPAECYQQLYNAGIGSMVADFYIAWAYCYDLVGNMRKADEVFRRGIACRALPLEDLREAHQHFGFTVAQRLMYKDDDSVKEETDRQLQERRLALTSLKGHRKKQLVGSLRTGAAVKNLMPGTVKSDAPSTSSHRSNVRIQVFKDENESPNIVASPQTEPTQTTTAEGKSVVRSIIDAKRNLENQIEPGPWNKAHLRKKGKLFGKTTLTNDLGFEIHEDDDSKKKEPLIPPIPVSESEVKFDKPFIYPTNFCPRSSAIKGWETPVTTEEEPDKNTIPQYNKCKLYPRPNVEFQPEELKAFYILKKLHIQSDFYKERIIYWGCGPDYNICLYPHFAKQSKQQKLDATDERYLPDYRPLNLKFAFDKIYNKEEKVERQFEEILALKIKRNETIIKTTDMDETMCATTQQRRKSFFPLRKSLASSAIKSTRKVSMMPECVEQNEIEINEDGSEKSIVKDNAKPSGVTIFEDVNNSNEAVRREISQKLTVTNQAEIDLLKSVETLRKEDSSNLPTLSNKPVQLEEDFQFKTPDLPLSIPKIHFDIFEDDTASNKQFSNNVPNADIGCGSGSFFDPEETCSTQTFNIFLKSQSVSTPKVITKSQPQRLFGNVLKEVAFTLPEQQEEQQFVSTVNNNLATESSPSATAGYSPPRQQLSTILETSEHGTTQGTHTTGATTKSTLSSPEFEIESQVQSTTSNTQSHGTTLETVKELSDEISTITSHDGNVEELMTSLRIQNKTDISNQCQPHLVTPAAVRLQKRSENGGLNFSIFEDTIEKIGKQVGNFSRLEEKEDTAAGFVYKQLPQIRFQDDKTETISKMLTTPLQTVQFPEDKTETITKILMAPLQTVQFPEDKTETISKILMAPLQTIQFPEDKTETISKMLLAPPHPIKFPEDNTENVSKFEDNITDYPLTQKSSRKELMPEPMSQDDSFKFFGETPTKAPKISKIVVKEGFSSAQIRTAAGARTPLTFDSKRFCNKETPDIQKYKSRQNALFEDELHSQNIVNNKELSQKQKVILSDSFMPDFSLIEESQPKDKSKIIPPFKRSKSVLRDSFIPDFSIIEDSQPQCQHKPLPMKTKNNSFLPDFSIIEDTQVQKQSSQTKQQKFTNNSFLPDFTQIPETQPNDSVILQSQTMEPRLLKKQNKTINSSVQSSLTDFSKTATDIQLKDNADANHWKQTPNPKSVTNQTQDGTNLKNILMDTFMKDFSEINEPPPIPKDVKEMTMVQPNRSNTSLKFLNESFQQKTLINRGENISKNLNTSIKFSTSNKDTKLSFLEPAPPKKSPKSNISDAKYFELNCETEMFGTNMSMIKNSTWLPHHGPDMKTTANSKQLSHIQEDSLHINQEDIPTYVTASTSNLDQTSKTSTSSSKPKLSFLEKSHNFSIDISATELAEIKNAQKLQSSQTKKKSMVITESAEQEDDCEMSIYYKQTPKTPKVQIHIWDDAEAFKTPFNNNRHLHSEPDLNQTQQVIESICIDPNVNPFNVDLIHAFLEQNYFINYLESLPSCMLVGSIQRLKQNSTINVNGVKFEVLKLIGEGAYGAVFCGKESGTNKVVAMKQEKPPNYWEYYICLEIQARIQIDEMLPAYMIIDNALIGNNSSILISQFSQYGSLISVCNKIKKHTQKNVDEYVVMLMACELLAIMDHLHAVNIIHADIKADNFLLIGKLTYPSTERCLQLIDFGVSIDMKLFKQGQTFSFVHNDNSFKCPEMREQRPWTYQLDLYGLAGVLHVLLFGKFMDIERKSSGIWMHKTYVPRYFNKSLWDTIFKTLLNIRDCNSMPNLQDLRALLKEEIQDKEKYVAKMVIEFNKALNN